MRNSTRVRVTILLTTMAWLMVLAPAHAYIDAGSTSIIFTAVVAALAAIGTYLSVAWSRITAFFRRDQNTSESPADPKTHDQV